MLRVVKFVKLRSVIFENFWQVGGSSGSHSSSIIETVDRTILNQLVCNWAIIGRSVVNHRSMITCSLDPSIVKR